MVLGFFVLSYATIIDIKNFFGMVSFCIQTKNVEEVLNPTWAPVWLLSSASDCSFSLSMFYFSPSHFFALLVVAGDLELVSSSSLLIPYTSGGVVLLLTSTSSLIMLLIKWLCDLVGVLSTHFLSLFSNFWPYYDSVIILTFENGEVWGVWLGWLICSELFRLVGWGLSTEGFGLSKSSFVAVAGTWLVALGWHGNLDDYG